MTPRFAFLPDTQLSLAVDYFDIEVNGEIANLGAANILSSCYASDFFPTDPLCGLFARVGDLQPGDPDYNSGSPFNVAFVNDSFLNVNSQKNEGIDVTFRAQHDFAGDTTLTRRRDPRTDYTAACSLPRRIDVIFLPRASSSTSLSMYRILRMSGSSISSTR